MVHDIFFFFLDGQITAMVGPNGYGRSTLLNLCRGQPYQTQGEVPADGKSLFTLSRAGIARTIALLPQNRTIPDITVDTLVLHGHFPWLGYPRVHRREDKAAVESAMTRMGIQERSYKLFARLPGEGRQRAHLTMLLAQNTGHILLDEPTIYLDINHQLQSFSLLTELEQEGECVITALHDLDAALELAGRVAATRKGRLLVAGTPERVILSGAIEDAFGVRTGRKGQYTFLR